MGLLKDIKELVGINTGDDEEDIEEMEQEQTSKALSKRQKMEEEVDEFRYEEADTLMGKVCEDKDRRINFYKRDEVIKSYQ